VAARRAPARRQPRRSPVVPAFRPTICGHQARL
jgi:hypothetical protein